jgi:hypothetical protein
VVGEGMEGLPAREVATVCGKDNWARAVGIRLGGQNNYKEGTAPPPLAEGEVESAIGIYEEWIAMTPEERKRKGKEHVKPVENVSSGADSEDEDAEKDKDEEEEEDDEESD